MKQLETILNHIQGGVILCNYDGAKGSSEVVYINRGWTEITGYTQEELAREKGGNPQALVLPEDKADVDAQYQEQMCGGSVYELMYRIFHKSGEVRWVIDKGMVIPLPDGKMENQSIITDVTAIKAQEERLRLLAQTDQLTDLNNKTTFALLAQNVLSRQREKQHALLLLDIDNFKGVNDSHGHAFGDRVLESVAARMKELFRSRDVLGRAGGDEFLVLMIDIPHRQVVAQKADELRRAIRDMKLPGVPDTAVTVSIGGAFFSGSKSYSDLFEEADAALYQAKSGGKNQYVPSVGE